MKFSGFAITEGSYVGDDELTKLLRFLALAVMLARKRFQRFGKTYEADGQRTMFQHFTDFIIRSECVRINPHALSHQEGEVANQSAALYLVTVKQLLHDLVQHVGEQVEELVRITLGFDSKAGQVDGSEAQVAATIADFTGGVVDIA